MLVKSSIFLGPQSSSLCTGDGGTEERSSRSSSSHIELERGEGGEGEERGEGGEGGEEGEGGEGGEEDIVAPATRKAG